MDHDLMGRVEELLARYRVEDDFFARAYEGLPSLRKAQMKSLIAFHVERYGMPYPGATLTSMTPPDGESASMTLEQGCGLALCVLGPGFDSCSRLLAAVMPALCGGVSRAMVLCLGVEHAGEIPDTLLPALELAGVEDVYAVPEGISLLETLGELISDRHALRVLFLPSASGPEAEMELPGRIRPDWCGRVRGPGVVHMDGGCDPDPESITFFHPDLDCHVRLPDGQEACLPQEMRVVRNQSGPLLEAGNWSVLFTGQAADARTLEEIPLVFGPGREYMWFWPELLPEMFRQRGVALF